MKKYFCYVFCLLTSVFMAIASVSAEATTTTAVDTSCNYASRAYLNKMAGSVTASADFKYDKSGKVSFAITIYNISEDIYILVTPNNRNKDATKGETIEIFPAMTENNQYTIVEENITDIIDYEIVVRTTKYGCVHDIRKFTVTKPKKNKFHDMNICKYESVVEYYYCQEWITNDFTTDDNDIIDKINRERKKQNENDTTKCVDCDKTQEAAKKTRQLRLYIIAGLIVAIIIDIVVMLITIKNARSASEW